MSDDFFVFDSPPFAIVLNQLASIIGFEARQVKDPDTTATYALDGLRKRPGDSVSGGSTELDSRTT